jgi:hypothetical protein
MSSAGVPVDVEGWKEHARKTEADAARLKDELNARAPEHPDSKEWNFGSPQQVRKAAKLLGVDLPLTRDETLALYSNDNNFVAALRDYRKASKLAKYLRDRMVGEWLLPGRTHLRLLAPATGSHRQDGLRPP